ncbi:phage tail protein [Leptospira kirschneri]|uniref:phage tail protein n=1 Tax=Leptospira kirschneri TaxID=29507 RepID=UPI000289B2F6|nr:phage tail protein [Leptospira kirschneri]EMK15599.1 tail fiber domain protein [Leptospira kirschneri serovar Bim str. PUO 1247]EMN03065.1 tail fiber domain protein [Leptospira kirschneri serovar Bim str. 1051]EPG49370.1 tail fiber domain protein [Leptospira kirschneri serovar Cynopteri str. 3522 CT]
MTYLNEVLEKYPSSIFTRDSDSTIAKKWEVELELLNEVRSILESISGITDYRVQNGTVLDLIGKNLKQPRNGMDDFRYKIFLSIARQKRKSKGDIFSMNEIGSQILTGIGTLYEIKELCYGGVPMLLDATYTLNGEYPLSGSTKRPATIEVIFTGSIDELPVVPEFNQAIAQIRPGGVKAIIRYRFEMSTLGGRLYGESIRTPYLDGSWSLNGFTLLSGEKVKIRPYEIAFGIGGLEGGIPRAPKIGDTGLQNEIYRKLVEIRSDSDGNRYFQTTVKQGEMMGYGINEIGLFDEDGELLYLKTFPSKDKDHLIVYDFVIKEEFQ